MDSLVLLALLLVSLPLGYLAWSLLSVDRKSQRAIREMLARGTDAAGAYGAEARAGCWSGSATG